MVLRVISQLQPYQCNGSQIQHDGTRGLIYFYLLLRMNPIYWLLASKLTLIFGL